MQPRFIKCLNPCCDCGPGGTPGEGDTDELLFSDTYSVAVAPNDGVVIFAGAPIPPSTPTYTVIDDAAGTRVKIERSGQYRATFVLANTALIPKIGISIDSADVSSLFTVATVGMREFADALVPGETDPDRICLTAVMFVTAAMAADAGLGIVRWQSATDDPEIHAHARLTRVGDFGG
jgi:hypothetical protein